MPSLGGGRSDTGGTEWLEGHFSVIPWALVPLLEFSDCLDLDVFLGLPRAQEEAAPIQIPSEIRTLGNSASLQTPSPRISTLS